MSNKLLKSGFREGFLKKKHAVKKKIWRRLWFVLTNDKLWYYNEKGELRGEIIMQNVLRVENWEPSEDEKDSGLKFCFEIETKGEENKKGKTESKYILQAGDRVSFDNWIYHLDVVAAVNFYASNPKLNTSRRFVKHCELILLSCGSYLTNSVHFSRNTFLRGDEAKILDMNHQLCPNLFRLLEASMRYVVQRGEANRAVVIAKAKEFEDFSLRVFNLWEYISQLDGVVAETVRNIVMVTSDCVRAVHELAQMDISSEIVTEDNTPATSPMSSPRPINALAEGRYLKLPRSAVQIRHSSGPRSVDSGFLRPVENIPPAGKESQTAKPSTSWQPVSKATLRKTQSESSDIGVEELNAGHQQQLHVNNTTSASEGNSPVSLSPIKEEEKTEADLRNNETIFNLDLVEQVEKVLNSITETTDNNGVPEIVIRPRKKRSFVAKFEKPDPNNQIDDCVKELTEMQFEIAKEVNQQPSANNNNTSSGWKSYSPHNTTRRYNSTLNSSSRSSVIVVSDPNVPNPTDSKE